VRDLLFYFLRLGTFGFGGPIALAGRMRRDLVEAKRWYSERDYAEGLALAQLAPGPLAAQLAMYLGWVRAGVAGATLVGAAFVLPSFLMVLILSALYVRYGGLPWMSGAFYGIGAAVIALVGLSAWKLVRATLGKDRLLFALCAISAVVTAWTGREAIALVVVCGIVALFVKAPPAWGRSRRRPTLGLMVPSWLVTGMAGAASLGTLGKVGLYFATAGAFVFGSGLAIVPFLHGGVVEQYHWLTERQFLDAVAVAMVTPGPVVITVAFIGYLVAGPLGAVAAALGVFLPCYLFVVVAARQFRRAAQNPSVKAFVDGVTAAATGAIAGAVVVLGRRSLVDVPTVLIALATLAVLLKAKKVPEPLVILAAGTLGALLKG
jgi:chromate transporter